METYLESPPFWSDFHARFINYWCEAIADRLGDQYEARIEERVNLVEVDPRKVRRFQPDVAVTRAPGGFHNPPRSAGMATLEPVVLPLLIEEETRETYIQILHRGDRSLVAVLELLSPSNKEEPDRSTYLARRNACLHHEVHLVELDLLRKGERIPMGRDYPAGEYFCLVADATRRPDCDVYAWMVPQALPAIPVPLRIPDPPVWVDMAEVFATTYGRGRYARSIDYAQPPSVSLSADELEWIVDRARLHAAEGAGPA